MSKYRFFILGLVAFFLGFAWMSTAFADSCDNLDNNRAWNRGFEKISDAYHKQDYDAALEYSKTLEGICEQSPILNYTIARIHQSRGDREKYLFYLQKATQNTERFSVDKDLLDKLWSEKYIAANPDADPEAIAERKALIESQAEEINTLKNALSAAQQTASQAEMLQQQVTADRDANDILLWTSVGVGAAGLALTAVGAVFVGMHHDKAVAGNEKGVYVKSEYSTGWALVGAGIGMTVIGAAAAGYFGYQYHQNHKDSGIGDVSFSITPTYTSLSFAF